MKLANWSRPKQSIKVTSLKVGSSMTPLADKYLMILAIIKA